MEEGTQRVYVQDIKTSSEVPRNEANETKRILKKETERNHNNRFDNTIRQKEICFPTQKQQACHQIECLRTCLWQRTKKTSQETRKIFRIAKKNMPVTKAREKKNWRTPERSGLSMKERRQLCAQREGGKNVKREKGRLQGRRTRSIRKAWVMRYSFAILLLFRCVSAMFAGAAVEEFVFCATAPVFPRHLLPCSHTRKRRASLSRSPI